MPVMNSIAGKGNFTSNVIGIKNSAMFDKIGDALKTKAFDNMTLNNLGINFEIRDGRLMVDPFETKMGNTKLDDWRIAGTGSDHELCSRHNHSKI